MVLDETYLHGYRVEVCEEEEIDTLPPQQRPPPDLDKLERVDRIGPCADFVMSTNLRWMSRSQLRFSGTSILERLRLPIHINVYYRLLFSSSGFGEIRYFKDDIVGQ